MGTGTEVTWEYQALEDYVYGGKVTENLKKLIKVRDDFKGSVYRSGFLLKELTNVGQIVQFKQHTVISTSIDESILGHGMQNLPEIYYDELLKQKYGDEWHLKEGNEKIEIKRVLKGIEDKYVRVFIKFLNINGLDINKNMPENMYEDEKEILMDNTSEDVYVVVNSSVDEKTYEYQSGQKVKYLYIELYKLRGTNYTRDEYLKVIESF